MGLWGIILKELRTPDDQGNNWYTWATNQCGHIVLGAFATAIFIICKIPAWLATLGVGSYFTIFEIKELLHAVSWRMLLDKFNDISFVWAGSLFVFFLYTKSMLKLLIVCFSIALLQVCGIIPRIHRALKSNAKP